jgi:hypothetical protein
MPYNIDRYSGTTPVVVEDGTINSTFDIKLVGKNYAGYGEVQNENFVHMLENFSGTGAPPRPISGQIWFDSFTNKLKFFDKNNNWRTTGGAEIGGTEPVGLTTGDFWFDSDNNQLYAKSAGGPFILIGPQTAAGLGATELRSRTVRDILGDPHAIIEAIVDAHTVQIISADEFTLDNGVNEIIGFADIKRGTTLVNTGSTGVTSTTHRFWGTASNSLKAGSTLVDGSYRLATTANTANTLAARDGSGDVYATVFQGVASSAQFADLAEKYLADAEYAPGTVMVIGGEKEITASTWGKRAIGAVSTNPAYMMNSELEGGTYVALKGRVPVKVVGTVRKGDNLIAANDGCASVGVHHSNDVFAIALESSNDSGVKLIEAIIL